MKPERWQRVDELLDTVLELPPGARSRFLRQAAGDNPEIFREVASLLEFEKARDFLDQPAFDVHQERGVGRRVGRYRTVRLLGRGGMGAVYLAVREDDYDQRVALKLIKRGMDSEEIIRRFRNERQILAHLNHPYIAKILDGGTTEDGLPFFVMEYVEGRPIDVYCDDMRLPTRGRIRLFRKVCSAVHLSHQHLVVHRDLKPSNILVTEGGVPKLLDFGIAKLLEPGESPMTAPGQRPMTLPYASPEQAQGESVRTTSDVYALGVLLYELLTGRPPYDLSGCSLPERLHVICQTEPRKPSTAVLQTEEIQSSTGVIQLLLPDVVSWSRDGDPRKLHRRLAGDLDAIVLKAMRKEPQLRYGSVEQFSEDIRRHLEGVPVAAQAGTFTYRAGKFVRRNRLALAIAVGFVVLSSGFSATTTVLWKQAVRDREQARLERARAFEVSAFLERLFEANEPDQTLGRTLTARDILDRGKSRLAEDLEGEPELQADMTEALGRVYRKLGVFDEALDLMKESFRLTRQLYPGDHWQVAERSANLAAVLYNHREYRKAEILSREALAMRRRLGQQDSELVTDISNLGTFLMSQGAYSEAEIHYRESLAIREQAHGADHPAIASSLHQLGTLLYAICEFDQAETYLHRALELRRRAYGPEHTLVTRTLNNLGSVEHARGNLDKAEAYFRQALAIRRKLLGDNHAAVARTKRHLASLHLDQGSLEAAGVLLIQARETLRTGPVDGATQSVYGAYLASLGRYREAEPYLLESYPRIKQEKGEGSVYARDAHRRVVNLYQAWGKPDKVDEYRAMGDAD